MSIRKEGHGRSAWRLGCHKAPGAAINGLHANPSRVSELYEALIAAGAPRWQAIGLLHRFGGYQVGKTFLVDRLDLIRQLEEIAAGKQFEFETVRHERVVIQVDKTRKYRQATAVTISLRPQATYGLEGLAAGIDLQPRKLTVEFAGAEDFLAKLYEFSQTIANDFERFRKAVESNPGT